MDASKAPSVTGSDPSPRRLGDSLGEATVRVAALAKAPDPDLVLDTPSGPLPVIGKSGRLAWQVYARPSDNRGRPRIAVVLASLGLSQAATKAAIQQLPGAVTLAFAPYGRDLQRWVDDARAAGHEVMLQVPMEPLDYPINDPGPHTLLTSLPSRGNLDRLEWSLARFTGYVGIVNYMGSRFITSEAHIKPMLEALRDRGLLYLDGRSSDASVAARIATDVGLPRVINDRHIDQEASRASIDANLRALEDRARNAGHAVGIGFPYPVTIERLGQWARGLAGKGIDLVPVSALVNQQPAP